MTKVNSCLFFFCSTLTAPSVATYKNMSCQSNLHESEQIGGGRGFCYMKNAFSFSGNYLKKKKMIVITLVISRSWLFWCPLLDSPSRWCVCVCVVLHDDVSLSDRMLSCYTEWALNVILKKIYQSLVQLKNAVFKKDLETLVLMYFRDENINVNISFFFLILWLLVSVLWTVAPPLTSRLSAQQQPWENSNTSCALTSDPNVLITPWLKKNNHDHEMSHFSSAAFLFCQLLFSPTAAAAEERRAAHQ